MKMEVFENGQIILRQGEPGATMYYIMAGRVGVYLDHGTPEEKQLAELGEGQFFGEMSLLSGEKRSATIVSLEDDTCAQVIDRGNVTEFCREYPEKVFAIMQQLSERLRAANASR